MIKNQNIPTIVLCALIVLISSCTQPFDETDYESDYEDEVIYQEETEQTDVYRNNEPDIESESPEENQEEIIEEVTEEEPMMIKPIDNYEAYAFADGKLRGINGSTSYPIEVYDTDVSVVHLADFYKDVQDLFFKIEKSDPVAIADTDPVEFEIIKVYYYFKQTAQGMEEITADQFTPSESVHIEMDETPFKIATTEYKGMTISRVSNGTLLNSYLKIDGYKKNSDGLWFSVSEEYGTLKSGLYFWSNTDTASRRKCEYVRVY